MWLPISWITDPWEVEGWKGSGKTRERREIYINIRKVGEEHGIEWEWIQRDGNK